MASSAANTLALAGRTSSAYTSGDSAPAHESNSWMALAPASTWASSDAMAMSARRSSSSRHRSGSPCIIALVWP